jgi:hypothetical protein
MANKRMIINSRFIILYLFAVILVNLYDSRLPNDGIMAWFHKKCRAYTIEWSDVFFLNITNLRLTIFKILKGIICCTTVFFKSLDDDT